MGSRSHTKLRMAEGRPLAYKDSQFLWVPTIRVDSMKKRSHVMMLGSRPTSCSPTMLENKESFTGNLREGMLILVSCIAAFLPKEL
jgi:hypothetical protein